MRSLRYFGKAKSRNKDTENPRITAQYGLEGALKILLFLPLSLGRDTFYLTELLRAISSLTWTCT